jgi:hypothetical protein
MTVLTEGTLFSDLIEKVYRRVMGNVRERFVYLPSGITNTATTFSVQGPQSNSIGPGTLFACDLEVMSVISWNAEALTVTVERGYGGSLPAAHSANAYCYINPQYSRYDIAVAINDDLRSLSASGLYRVGVAQITYNPTFMGYDLGGLPANYIEVLGIRFKIAPPYRNYPAITSWVEDRYNPDASVFPSSMGLYIYESGWPGLPLYVTYSAPFLPLYNLTDDITNTPVVNDPAPPNNGYTVTTVPNLAYTMVDIPPLGAEIDLTLPQEIGRNRMASQPDPRKAAEVPAGAITNSASGLVQTRTRRIQEEADRLVQQLYFVRGW